jgi:glycerol dehydrogenase
MIESARFPGRYLQGPGALARLGEEARGYGNAALALLDGGVFEQMAPRIRDACTGHLELVLRRHGGECSPDEIDAAVQAAQAAGSGLVIGIGGGKVLDTAKLVAHELGQPVVIVPTIAASDAPCSALAIVYGPDGTTLRDQVLPRSPDLVLVDTEVIAQAPARMLAAGIGDALATWYEAESCRRSGAPNMMGSPGVPMAHAIAAYCRDVVWEFAEAALAECDADRAGPALERIVEANILASGIGFESGGVAAAHAIHHGLCELDEVHHHLHGEKVAIGILAGLLLHEDMAEFERVRAFLERVRLPVRLSEIGITDASLAKLEKVAARACRAGEIIHFEPIPISEAMVVRVLQRLA